MTQGSGDRRDHAGDREVGDPGDGDGEDGDTGDGGAAARGAGTHRRAGAGAAERHGDGRAPRAGEEALFAALDRTRADLAGAPTPPLPAGFATRMQAALDAERAAGRSPAVADAVAEATPEVDAVADTAPGAVADTGPASDAGAGPGPRPRPGPAAPDRGPGSGPAPGRPPGRHDRRRPAPRRRRVLAGGLAALAVAAAVVGLAVATRTPPGSRAPTAAPPTVPAASPVTVSGDDPVRALRSGLGARDPGPLADPARRAACLVAHGLPADTVPLGSRQVVVDGVPGTLLVLPTGAAARFRLLAVGPTCGPGSPATLVDRTVGG